MIEAVDKVSSPRSMDGSPFSIGDKPLKMKGDENDVFRRPPADEARDGFVSNMRLLTNSLIPRHGWRGEFNGLAKGIEFGETRKPRFSGFERKKPREGLFLQSIEMN